MCIFRPPRQPRLTKPEQTAERRRWPWTGSWLMFGENDPVDGAYERTGDGGGGDAGAPAAADAHG